MALPVAFAVTVMVVPETLTVAMFVLPEDAYRQGHNYEDFQNYMKDHPDINVVEMDCVEGKKGESRALLTFTGNCTALITVQP